MRKDRADGEMNVEEMRNKEELTNDLLAELADTNTNFCVVCNGTFRDFAELKRFLKERRINVIYQTTSQGKLLVIREGKRAGEDEEKRSKEN